MVDPLDQDLSPDLWDSEDPRAVRCLELLMAGYSGYEAERIIAATWDGDDG